MKLGKHSELRAEKAKIYTPRSGTAGPNGSCGCWETAVFVLFVVTAAVLRAAALTLD
jgi:hypothetical protein